MFGFLIAVQVVISLLLILVILMQSSKGGGLAGTFGGGSVGMVFGVRRTADFLTRSTQILAGVFVALCLVINIFFLPRSTASTESVLQRNSGQRSATQQPQPQLPPSQGDQNTPTQPPPVGGQ